MRFPLMPLGELVTIAKGRKAPEVYETKVSDSKRYIQINDLRTDEKLSFAVDPNGVEVHLTDLCIAWDGANAGTVGYGLSGFIGSTISRLRPKKVGLFVTPYVGRFIQSKFQILNAGTTGATIPHVSKDKLTGLKVPFPPLPEQRRIAAILDKADAIRRKRQEAIRLTEELLRSAFLEMFGDPVTNPKGWKVEILDKHINFLTTGSRGWAEYYTTEGSRFIRSLDVQMNYISNDNIAYVNPPVGAEAARTRVNPGDVLLTVTGSKIGRVAPVSEAIKDAYVSQHVAIIRLSQTLRARYLSMFLSLPHGGQLQILRNQYGQTKPGLNLEQIRKFKVPCPPIAQQDRFVDLWERLAVYNQRLEEADLKAKDLFTSLIQGAFRGELTIHHESAESVIPLPVPIQAEHPDARKVVPLKRAKKEPEELASAEAKRHGGHDMYNKAALAAYIVSRCHDPAEPMGRVKLAKLFYLVQRKVDLALTETFTRRAAGPLDDAIHKFLPFAQKNNWIKLLPQVGIKKPVGPGSACEVAVKQAIKYLSEKRSAVDEVLNSLKGMKGHDLECWATVDAVAEELVASGKALTTRNIQQVLEASPEWRPKLEKAAFSELGITSALLGLRKMGLVTTG